MMKIMEEKIKKLNLGCGQFKKEGYINIDIDPEVKPDFVHNLNEFPYPFPDNHFDLIKADHVLEHLDNAFIVMKELHRILKPNGELVIKVPHFSRGFTHAGHKSGFDLSFPYYFNPSFKGGYTGVKYKLIKVKITWFAQLYLKRSVVPKPVFYIGVIMGKIIDFFANLSPIVCSRIWCYLVGGFEELEFHFICIK